MRRKIGNALFWFGAAVLITAYGIGALGAVADAYAASGLLGVTLALVLVSALPAIVVGAILGE